MERRTRSQSRRASYIFPSSIDTTLLDDTESECDQSSSLLPQAEDLQTENQTANDLSIVQTPGKQSQTTSVRGKDIFNEILYSISAPKESGRIHIHFSTEELYQDFMDNFKKGFKPQDPKDGMSTFKTHVQNKKCVIMAHDPENSIALTGPGNKLWRETVFPKLAITLYRQYEQKVNDLLTENNLVPPTPTPMMSSTPGCTGNADTGSRLNAAAQRASENLIKSVQGSQNEMKEQMISLLGMVKGLQGQLNELKSNLIFENTDSSKTSTVIMDLTHPNSEGNQTLDECNDESLVQEEPILTPGMGTYSATIQLSQNEPRPPNNISQTAPSNTVNNGHKKQTLLIGDSLLSGVNGKGMKNYVHCQPIPGATISRIQEKISMYDLNRFQNIIIYCGGNDAAKADSPNSFRKDYETLIEYIRSKNSDCELFLCGSSPRGDVDVIGFNTVIKTIAESHGYKYVNIYDAFYDSNEQLRTKFYGLRDWIHLSTPGIRRLLGTIHQMIPIVEDFRYCAYPQDQGNLSKRRTGTTGSHRGQRDNTQRSEGSLSHYGTRSTYHQSATDNQSNQRSVDRSRGRQYSGYVNQETYPREQAEWPDMLQQPQQRANESSARNQHYFGTQLNNASGYNQATPKERCTKCGLTNHSTYDCHHKRQLLCYACNYYGHKDSICWNQ